MASLQPRKSISSRYANKIVNPKYYCTINVTSGQTTVSGSGSTGLIYLPYVMKSGTPIIEGFDETLEEKAERIREERYKKLERIFKDGSSDSS